MTKTFEELEAKVYEVQGEVERLRIELYGDKKARELYETNRANNVTPNIAEPPSGVFDGIIVSISAISDRVNANSQHFAKSISDVTQTIAWANKLQKFFSPMIDGLNPPLDGSQVATKAFVDEGIARIAGAIREEIVRDFGGARDLVKTFLRSPLVKAVDPSDPDVPTTRYQKIVDRLSWTWAFAEQQFEDAQARARRPSRFDSLLYAVTGYTKTNGVQR